MVETLRLSNGMGVVLEQMENLRSVSFGIFVRVGSVDETVENNGISHAIEHMLFKGTENRTARRLAEDTARLGGSLNAYTSKELTSFYVTTLDVRFEEAAELLGDMLLHSVFSEKDWEKEKEVILEEIDMYEDSPDDLVHEMLQKQVWRDHPLGFLISGEKKTVSAFTAKQLKAFKEEHYRAERMVLSVAGHFERSAALSCLERIFGETPAGRPAAGIPAPVYRPCLCRREKDIEQVHMNLAFQSIDSHAEEKYVLSVANTILGGADNSRLFQTIREEEGLAYSIYSYESLFDKAGLLHIDTVLNPSKGEKAFEVIHKQLKLFKERGAGEEELLCAREQLKTGLIIGSESTRNRMSGNARDYLCGDDILSPDEIIEKINRVTNEEILAFLDRHLDTDHFGMALVGAVDKMRPGILQ